MKKLAKGGGKKKEKKQRASAAKIQEAAEQRDSAQQQDEVRNTAQSPKHTRTYTRVSALCLVANVNDVSLHRR